MQQIILNNEHEMIDYLIDTLKKDNINMTDSSGQTLLHNAVAYNNIYVARLLIKAGADINARTNQYEDTPLHIAGDSAFINMMRLLIKTGADFNKENASGKTPLDLLQDRNTSKYNEYKEELIVLNTKIQTKRLNKEDIKQIIPTGYYYDM